MLVGRATGLAMTFTTVYLNSEEEAASLLGIRFKAVMQAGLLLVACEGLEVQTRLEAGRLQVGPLGQLVTPCPSTRTSLYSTQSE
jgi:hypothetical protein